MTTSDISQINIKRFVGVYLLCLLVGFALALVAVYVLNFDGNFGFLTLLIPMVAAIDTGGQYATRHNAPMDKTLAWQVALRLNWIHMGIQLILTIIGVILFLPALQSMGIELGVLIIIMLVILMLVFGLSWLFIRWGLSTGAKSTLKQAARKAEKNRGS